MSSDLLKYLALNGNENDGRLPSLRELSQILGVSVASLREQLAVARALGLVEVRPKTGIRKLNYSFGQSLRQSLSYAVSENFHLFFKYADLRRQVEKAYWESAVSLLDNKDLDRLSGLVQAAFEKMKAVPIKVPHYEHREFHLLIYSKLENPFVLGLLEAYWDIYEAIGLDLYTDFEYLHQVWLYHGQMVDAIQCKDFIKGSQILSLHSDLLYERKEISSEKENRKLNSHFYN